MTLELDHVFSFIEPSPVWEAALAAVGLVVEAGTYHHGQGTRNRRVCFRAQYLELVWVSDAREAAANLLRLDRRANWKTTGASPFGLGLRGQLPAQFAREFFSYRPRYAPNSQVWIHNDNRDEPSHPLLFVFETGTSGESMLPKNRFAPEAFNHRPARHGIKSIRFTGQVGSELLRALPNVAFEQSRHVHMAIELDGGPPDNELALAEHVSIRG